MGQRAFRTTLGVGVAAVIAACGVGGTTPTGDFTVVAGAAAPSTLGATDTFHVTLVSTGGFSGPVLLTFTGVPADWIVTLSQNPVTLVVNGAGGSTVSITIPTNGTPAASGQPITVHATGPSLNHTAATTVTVANEVIVPIALGTDTGAHWGALAGDTIHLSIGTTFTVRNDDSVAHQVHFNSNTLGLLHESGDLALGASYSQPVTGAGTDQMVCHDHPSKGGITITSP